MKSVVAPNYTVTPRPLFARKSRRGFTLAELLIAVMLLSLVMTAVYSMTHTALNAWRSVENGYDIYAEARNVMTLFSHEYNNIVARAAHLFEGDNKKIVMFVIAQPLDLEQGEGPRLLRVEYAYNRSKRSIEREEALVEAALPMPNPDGEPVEAGRIKLSRKYKTTVANNVKQFRLRYVWAPLPEEALPNEPPIPEPLIIIDRHLQRYGLPQAVEITFELFDPENEGQTYSMSATLPIRATSYRRSQQALEEMFNADA
ncbi:MAG TPA: prepilin-type N-terminal cleavage/methylation domain-containing protein [Candidatus Hydrogenedentes bacterium]|nr:prepilin-type N-terminal cleavage/methylation domain-containing protein [Candidatus Hydrogenedentota bacterium]